MKLPLIAMLMICVSASAQTRPRTLNAHPGNVFLADEVVSIDIPTEGAWRLVDYEGNPLRSGDAAGSNVELGKLPVGYYELRRGGTRLTTIGVIAALAAATPDDSPIGLDVAMAWFYKIETQQRAAANLCA